MFVLIWAVLLFSVRGNNAGTGASTWGQPRCDRGYCVALSEQELTAEAGLCVVVPCSFTTADVFTPKHVIWFKCGASNQKCGDADRIFHSNKNTDKNTQPGFEGRVSLLEPDVNQKNCSIIINDLKASDAGSYRLRVTGEVKGERDGFTFTPRVTVSVKGLIQKPTVTIPTLTEGQQATLTCTAPGLCSGSVPEITWTWRGAGGTQSHITDNITAFRTENLTTFTQRHISTLTFDPSAKYHNTNVTCKILFSDKMITEETSALKVNYVKKVKITGVTSVREGEGLNLTCSLESFPPSLVMWWKLGSNTNLHDDTGSSALVIPNVTAEHAGQYICTAEYMNNTLKDEANITVIYKRPPQIIGNTTVKEGDVLNLTCSVESFPPALIVWKNHSFNTNHNDTGSSALVIHNVTAEHAGQYICTAKYMNNTFKDEVNITVIYKRPPQIIGNTTVKEGDVLNLTCSVESFPPALIMWKYHSFNTNHNDTGSAALVIHNVTAEHAGQYICTAKHLNTTVTSYTNITVNYFRTLQIIGNTTVKERDVLNLTCSVESVPPALIVWKKMISNTYPHNGTNIDLHSDTGSAVLAIKNVTTEHTGEYICTAKHLDTTVTSHVDVIVTWLSKIQEGFGCVLQSEGLACVCISEGFPLPTIKWPLLKNHTEYSVITTVSNHTVNSTVSLTVKNHGNSTVECVSNNGNGEERGNLLIHKNLPEKHEQSSGFRLGSLKIIIAFLSGVLLSAIICLAKNCYRKKQKSSRKSDETSEMQIRRDDKLQVYYGQALQDHLTLNLSSGPTEVVYANINFSLLKRNHAREATRRQESTKTEYAEIKTALKEDRENDAVEEEDIFSAKEEKAMVELKMEQPENKKGGEEAVYSTVNDIIDGI